MDDPRSGEREWLEADGCGGFASGTASGVRTRRYHGLLLTATTPPTGRVMLVNGLEVWATTPAGRVALSTHCYVPGVEHPDGVSRLRGFGADPWPTWTWDLGDGRTITQEIVVTRDRPRTVCRWTLDGPGPVTLEVRPLLSGRDYHALHHENPAFQFASRADGAAIEWQPYAELPIVRCTTTGTFHAQPEWFRQYLYPVERERGLDDTEDLASPGVVQCSMYEGRAVCVFETTAAAGEPLADAAAVRTAAATWFAAERRRRAAFPTRAHRAADAYLVQRGGGRTVIAGYPWFTDWGRDTFIALRGLCLAGGRLADARDILLEWAGAVDAGMLPNRFPDAGDAPEFNAVDASLWFVVAAGELLAQADGRPRLVSSAQRRRLHEAIGAILAGYAAGTRYGIRLDDDGLLAAGEPGQQLTWMDARVGDREITPRIGKPVEIQALWGNALQVGTGIDARWALPLARLREAFEARFWRGDDRGLFDVVDVDHRGGTVDATVRPNQIFAVGGLPQPLITGPRARAIVDLVERQLWTPLGLRTLPATAPGYVARYEGPPWARDAAYHQGTVWPWLLGAFVDAWLAVRGRTADARAEAGRRFVAPLRAHLHEAGIGHVSEIADADAPHTPRGCPWQAWSVGELLRLEALIGPDAARPDGRRSPSLSRSTRAAPAPA
ncbi:MAG: amylo-alpha-1,6-glucosidase [Vicinamibacterales bacterium]